MKKEKEKHQSKAAAKRMQKHETELDKQHVDLEFAEGLSKEQKAKQRELQKSYDNECRKLNAARSFPEPAKSVEAIRLCGDNIVAIKKEVRELGLQLNIASDESFGTDEPHVHITKDGEHIFVCGSVRFHIDNKDLCKAIGVNGEPDPLAKLMDSQIAELARSIGLQISPFVRKLVEVPIRGMIQNVWYRDVTKNFDTTLTQKVDQGYLDARQAERVEKYHRELHEWNSDESGSKSGPARKERRASSTGKSSLMSKSFVVVKDGAKNVASGRESDLLAAMKTLKSAATFPQIVEAARKTVKTKQDFETIVARFLKELIGHGAVKES